MSHPTHESPKADRSSQQIGSKRFISNSKPTWQQTNEIRNFLGRDFMKIPLLKAFEFSFYTKSDNTKVTNQPSVWNVNFGKTLMQKRSNNLKYFPSWCIRERKFFSTAITVITTNTILSVKNIGKPLTYYRKLLKFGTNFVQNSVNGEWGTRLSVTVQLPQK